MERKNDYHMVLFTDDAGRVQIDGEHLAVLLESERQLFPSDYEDVRAFSTGHISARVLTDEELRGALRAFELYRSHTSYPPGYEAGLLNAIRRGQPPTTYRAVVLIP